MRILALAGSLRADSSNRKLLQNAIDQAPEGATVTEFTSEQLAAVEPFDEDVEATGLPAGAAAFAAAIRSHDALVIATPEYNGSVPGQLKNALDWASRADGAAPEGSLAGLPSSPLYGVPVGVMSASNGQFGAVWARDELAKALRTQGARPIVEPSVTLADADNAFDANGTLKHAGGRARAGELVAATVEMALALRAALAAR